MLVWILQFGPSALDFLQRLWSFVQSVGTFYTEMPIFLSSLLSLALGGLIVSVVIKVL